MLRKILRKYQPNFSIILRKKGNMKSPAQAKILMT